MSMAKYSVVFAQLFSAPLGAYMVGLSSLTAAVAFPLDAYWHALYGIDVAIWVPFHIMFIASMGLVALGATYMLSSAAHLASRCGSVGKSTRRAATSGKASVLGPILFGLFGLALIVVGLFVTDPLGGPPTVHGTVHNCVTLLVFSSLIAASFVLARRFAGDPEWHSWAPYSAITCVLVALFFIATNVAALLEQNGTLQGAPVGLLQRTAIMIGWGWIALFAFRLLLTARKASAQVLESSEMEAPVESHR
jgi:hypothetical protein